MRLFLSYAHQDRKKAQRLADMLRSGGHDVWTDTSIEIGAKWQEILHRNIDSSEAIVLALTPNWILSSWCQWEFISAIELNKSIVPVLLSTTALPPHLSQYNYFDLRSGFRSKSKIQSFLNEIEKLSQKIDVNSVPPVSKQNLEQEIDQQIRLGQIVGSTIDVSQKEAAGKADRQEIVVGDIRDSHVKIDQSTVIHSAPKQRDWTAPVIFGLVVAIIGAIAAVLALYPETQRNDLLYSLGMLPASMTPLPTATLTATATRTPTASPTPNLSQYDIGIAVAYFETSSDELVDRQEANTLIDQVYRRLDNELNELGSEIDITLGILPPAITGVVYGTSPIERESNAREIARKFGADIVLYGFITINERNQLEVTPEFYVLPDQFAEALEITGSYRLGSAIQVDRPLSEIGNALAINRPLSTRVFAASQIFTGITYYVVEDYENAISSFNTVLEMPEWQNIDGREVLHVLLGNTYARLASLTAQSGELAEAQAQIASAAAEYNTAVEFAPDYSRPYAGLASIKYLEWNVILQETGTSELEILLSASDYLTQAKNAVEHPQEIGPETKILYIQAQLKYWLWTLHGAELGDDQTTATYDEFWAVANQIVRRYDNGRNPSVRELASEALALMGLMSMSENKYNESVEHFEKAISLSYSSRRRMFFNGWLGDSYRAINELALARQAYRAAMELAAALKPVDESQIEYYQKKLDSLQSRG